ncbi:leukosialin [Bubalus kerabau]|uniref:leukosialin n=1 Tax=Bubalus carabanensis TaxID=3119969 RepID=UPI00244EBE07|nr:leukosialin [Bubalus carabanensis]
MPVALEMILLLLLFGSMGAENLTEVSPRSSPLWTSKATIASLSSVSETLPFNLVTTSLTTNKVSKMSDNPEHQILPPSSIPYIANVVSSPETSPTASRGSPVSESTISQEDSIKSIKPMKIPDAPSTPGVSVMKPTGFPTMTSETMATSPLETSNGTSGTSPLETSSATSKVLLTMATNSLEISGGTSRPPVTMATSSLETASGTSKVLLTMATSSLELSGGTSRPPVTMATSSLETASGTSKVLLTMATSSLELSGGTSRPPVTMATSSLETSSGTREPLVTTATSSVKTISMTSGSPVIMKTSSPKTSKGTSGLLSTMPATSLKTPMGTSGSTSHEVTTFSPNTSTNISRRDKLIPAQGTKGTLLVAVLVALLVVVVLVALILLWLRRQKRKTGVLTLGSSWKRNGAVDAWAGVAQVPDEEAMTATEGASGGNNDSDGPHREGSGQRPTLTTFFGRRKSRQGSMALEELKAGPASSLKGEEEPLVCNEDEGAEAPTSNGPEAREVKTP